MKKAMGVALGLFLLTSCGNTHMAPDFRVNAGVSGAKIDVNVISTRDASGNLIIKENSFVLQQPTVSFVAQAGSLGGVVHSATVTMKDSSGNIYGGGAGKYSQSFAATITPGWACTKDGVPDLQTGPIGCSAPMPVERSSSGPTVSQLISPQVAQQAAADCASAFGCPVNLRADIVFDVQDDRQTQQSIAVVNVPVSIYVNYKSEDK